jgi:hypothetical protein
MGGGGERYRPLPIAKRGKVKSGTRGADGRTEGRAFYSVLIGTTETSMAAALLRKPVCWPTAWVIGVNSGFLVSLGSFSL